MTITHLRLLYCVCACGAAFAQPAFAASTERVSVSSAEAEAGGPTNHAVITPDGRFLVFFSEAANLVPNDTNLATDIFVRDRHLGTTERVSVSSSEQQGDFHSNGALAITPDGRFVAFASQAGNLVAGDTNGARDIFVRDRQSGTTERVSVADDEDEAIFSSQEPAISADGRFVVFQSDATDLVGGDSNSASDIFLRDRQMGTTRRISVSSAEVEGSDGSFAASISANGRFVAFISYATNLVPNDDFLGLPDVFVRDRQSGTTEKISINSTGGEANGPSDNPPSISGNGRFVAFPSNASDLVVGDNNGTTDVFVRDRQADTTERVSVGLGAESNNTSFQGFISGDGRFVTYLSFAGNLVAGDTNDRSDIFVRDRQAGITQRVNVDSAGSQSSQRSPEASSPSISSDGRFVAFVSNASDLVPGDTNAVRDVFVRDRGLLSDSRNELLADLGNKGLWQRSTQGRWTKIDPDSAVAIASGDLDRSFIEEVIASFPGRGLEARFNSSGAWQNLHATAPDRVVSGDFDGNGVADIAGDFDGDLLLQNNNGAWIRRAAASEGLAVGDLDGNGEDDLIADRGAAGLFARYNNTNPWVQLHTLSPVRVAVGDVDGDGLDDLIADLGPGQGIFVRTDNSDPWRKVNAATSQGLTTGDLDDDGRDDIIADFPNGLRVRYNNVNPWFTLDTRSPSNVLSLDLDRNGEDDVVAGFTDAGISARLNGAGFWRILRPVLEQGFAEGSFN